MRFYLEFKEPVPLDDRRKWNGGFPRSEQNRFGDVWKDSNLLASDQLGSFSDGGWKRFRCAPPLAEESLWKRSLPRWLEGICENQK